MSLIITTPPAAEPITLAQVKARLRLTSTADDANITSYITSAREFCERISRRSLAPKSYAYYLDRFPYPYEPIRLPAPPLAAPVTVNGVTTGPVTGILYFDDTLTQQTWDASEYWVAQYQSPALIVPVPGQVYPSTARVPGAVQINFNSGAITPNDDWQRVIENVTVFIYEHPGEAVPEGLVTIPKIYVF